MGIIRWVSLSIAAIILSCPFSSLAKYYEYYQIISQAPQNNFFLTPGNDLIFFPEFYSDPDAAISALNGIKNEYYYLQEHGINRVNPNYEYPMFLKVSVKQVELIFKKLVINRTIGGVPDIDLASVWNIQPSFGLANTGYLGLGYYEIKVYTNQQTHIFLITTFEDTSKVANALATLVAASGGHLHEFSGLNGLSLEEQKKAKRGIKRGKLGADQGWAITDPPPGTPAQRAGFKAGDVLVTVKNVPFVGDGSTENKRVEDVFIPEKDARDVLRAALLRFHLNDPGPETSITIAGISGKEDFVRTLVLQDFSSQYKGPPTIFPLGISARPINDSDMIRLSLNSRNGLLITDINRFGVAAKLQLQVDDILIEVNNKPVSGQEDLVKILSETDKVESCKVIRKGEIITLTMPKYF